MTNSAEELFLIGGPFHGERRAINSSILELATDLPPAREMPPWLVAAPYDEMKRQYKVTYFRREIVVPVLPDATVDQQFNPTEIVKFETETVAFMLWDKASGDLDAAYQSYQELKAQHVQAVLDRLHGQAVRHTFRVESPFGGSYVPEHVRYQHNQLNNIQSLGIGHMKSWVLPGDIVLKADPTMEESDEQKRSFSDKMIRSFLKMLKLSPEK